MTTTYTDNGTNTPNGSHLVFSYTFTVLKVGDVKVSLNGVVQATNKYTATLSPKQITFNNNSVDSTLQESSGAPKTGVAVRVFRETDVVTASSTYSPGSAIRAEDLNTNQTQTLYALKELQEQENIYTFDSKYRVEPAEPTTDNDEGDLVYNTSTDQLKVYDGGSWKKITPTDAELTDIGVVAGDLGLAADYGLVTESATTASSSTLQTVASNIDALKRYAEEYTIASSAPSSPSEGDLWYDSTNNALKFYTGSSWVISASEGSSVDVIDEDSFATDSATRPPSQQSVKAYINSIPWLDQSTKEDGSVIYWKNSSSKYFADNAQNIKTLNGGNF
jgi:hypothetical protein